MFYWLMKLDCVFQEFESGSVTVEEYRQVNANLESERSRTLLAEEECFRLASQLVCPL
jgi:hypothetical protein